MDALKISNELIDLVNSSEIWDNYNPYLKGLLAYLCTPPSVLIGEKRFSEEDYLSAKLHMRIFNSRFVEPPTYVLEAFYKMDFCSKVRIKPYANYIRKKMIKELPIKKARKAIPPGPNSQQ